MAKLSEKQKKKPKTGKRQAERFKEAAWQVAQPFNAFDEILKVAAAVRVETRKRRK